MEKDKKHKSAQNQDKNEVKANKKKIKHDPQAESARAKFGREKEG